MNGRVRAVVLAGASVMLMSMPTHVAPMQAAHRSDGSDLETPQAVGVAPAAPAATDAPADTGRKDFQAWLEDIRVEALTRGIREETVNAALANVEPVEAVIRSDRSQAELVLSLNQYLNRRLTPRFIRTGREEVAKHRSLLNRVTTEYGVQWRFVAAIWAIESNFGRVQGTRPVIPALATLAWEGRRGAFFTSELFNALEIIDRGYISLPELRGSWAGAMGQPQFMPSSYLKHAQDFDQDGDRDIWRSLPDVFASIANYLRAYGWTPDQTWGREVRLPQGGARPLVDKIGLRTTGCRANREMTNPVPLARWQELGVRAMDGKALPKVDLNASLFHSGNRAFLLYGNYEAILGYNCAHTYALSVAMYGDRLR
jgi:membrane-bound lytic murein transglycosylase B